MDRSSFCQPSPLPPILFAGQPPSSRVENSYNKNDTSLSNSFNGNVINYNYYGTHRRCGTTHRDSNSKTTEPRKTQNIRFVGDSLLTEGPKDEETEDNIASLTGTDRTDDLKRTKKMSTIGSRRSRYGSAETVISMSEGECRLVPLTRKEVKFPGQHVSRQVERYMRTDFFGSSFVIPLWKASQEFISNEVRDHKARVITLGDVGYFDREGGFEVLFNVYKTAEENLAIGYDPPDNFYHYIPPPGLIYQRSVPVKEDEYIPLHGDFKESLWPYDGLKDYFLACESPASKNRMEATAIALPDGFTRHQTIIAALAAMQDYFNEQAVGWYNYYVSDVHKKNGLLKGSLKLITTCYTSRTWGAAAFVKEPSRDAQKVYAALYRLKNDEDLYSWQRQGDIRTRSGPTTKETKNNKATYESQCVAIEVTKIQVRQHSFFDFPGEVPSAMRSFVQSISSKIQLPHFSSSKIKSSTRSFSH